MAKLKLEIDYKRKEEQMKEISNIGLTINYIEFVVNDSHKEGLTGQLMRLWGRIQRKLEAAEEAKSSEIEIEEAEKDFIEKAIDKSKYPPKLAKNFMVFEDEVFPEEKKEAKETEDDE